MVKIVPAILTNSKKELKEMLDRCEDVVNRVQIDVVDGNFADNNTIKPSDLEHLDTKLKIDYQLMVLEPIRWVESCVKGKADRIIGHIEKMSNQLEFVDLVTEAGKIPGLALDLGTPVNKLNSAVLYKVGVILLMSVPAGFGGQKFDKKVITKIKRLYETRGSSLTHFKICIDGGLTKDSVPKVVEAGADEIIMGKSLFDGDLRNNISSYYDVF
jgi:ribulose-phosphate 3-epimerase